MHYVIYDIYEIVWEASGAHDEINLVESSRVELDAKPVVAVVGKEHEGPRRAAPF